MYRLNKQQKEKVQQFTAITGASDRNAISSLKGADWNLEAAFEVFYSSPLAAASHQQRADGRQQEELFLRYKDPNSDMILVDGISKLCQDLQVEPADIVMLVLSWHMKAATMGEFSKEEFMAGLQSLGVDSLQKLQAALPSLRSEMKSSYKFREIYDFSFGWAREKGQKSLALDTAIGMWQLLFSHNPWPYVEQWCEFLQEKHNKAISKDTWSQLLEFTKLSEAALLNYDDQGAWPYLIDDFVGYLHEKGALKSNGVSV